MASRLILKSGLAAGAAILATALTPAQAGRCGHSYPVDAPVTLAKVARACNVSLSALKEANPGVDPDYVTPGHHLAVPDEIAAADVPSGGADLSVDDDYYDAPVYRYAEYSEPAPSPLRKDVDGEAGVSPYFVRTSAYGAPQGAFEDPKLSYQKRSAERIRHAGVTSPAFSGPRSFTTVSAAYAGGPVSPLMECTVLRREANGKIRQAREFKPAPEGRDMPAHCARVETASAVFARSGPDAAQGPDKADIAVIEGYVSAADADCVTVNAPDGRSWRVAVDLAPMDFLGKHAMIWAETTGAKRCDGLVMASAVYAEPAR